MSMHTTQDWHNHSHANMSQAYESQRRAHNQCDKSHGAHQDTVTDNLTMYNNLQSSLESKVRTSHHLRNQLQERADSVANSIAQTRQSLSQLASARQAKDGPMDLCKWRMQQRERRPLREQVRDNVELALEAEKTSLADSMRRLDDAMRRTKSTIGRLEDKQAELRRDIDHKSQALGLDEACLRTTQRSYQTSAGIAHQPSISQTSPTRRRPHSARCGRTSGGRSYSGMRDGNAHESLRNEVNRQHTAMSLYQSGRSAEDIAHGVRDDNTKVILRCQQATEDARSVSETRIEQRVAESRNMRRSLECQIRDTHEKIKFTKNTICSTRQQIRSLEEPLENASTCNTWRMQRVAKEHISDPVTTQLQGHQQMLLQAHEGLRDHHDAERTALYELQHRKEQLKQDLQDKTAGLHIDINCLTREGSGSQRGSSRIIGGGGGSRSGRCDSGRLYKSMLAHASNRGSDCGGEYGN